MTERPRTLRDSIRIAERLTGSAMRPTSPAEGASENRRGLFTALSEGGRKPPTLPSVVHLADVVAERVSWLWAGRLAFGKLHILDGNPGLGKSLITIDWAARLTTGRPMPGEELALCPVAAVLFVAGEDGLADTTRPRLEAAGADISRCHALPTIKLAEGGERGFALPRDVPELEAAIAELGVKLVVIDPLTAHLEDGLNAYKDQDIRRAFLPLQQMAERLGVAVVIVRHLNKAGGAPALMRGGGSIAIVAAARVGLLVGEDPDDPDRRVLAVTKVNIAKRAPSLAFRLTLPADESAAPAVEWLEESELTADQLVTPPTEDERSAVTAAGEWLEAFLAGGGQPQRTVEREAKRDGISRASLRRARQQLEATSTREGFGAGGQWVWRLPNCGSPKGLNDAHRRSPSQDEHLCTTVSTFDENGASAAGESQLKLGSAVTLYAAPRDPDGRTCDGCGVVLAAAITAEGKTTCVACRERPFAQAVSAERERPRCAGCHVAPVDRPGDRCSVCGPRHARAKRPAA